MHCAIAYYWTGERRQIWRHCSLRLMNFRWLESILDAVINLFLETDAYDVICVRIRSASTDWTLNRADVETSFDDYMRCLRTVFLSLNERHTDSPWRSKFKLFFCFFFIPHSHRGISDSELLLLHARNDDYRRQLVHAFEWDMILYDYTTTRTL